MNKEKKSSEGKTEKANWSVSFLDFDMKEYEVIFLWLIQSKVG